MAEDKKGFILYADIIGVIKKITEKDRINNTNNSGELFLHILEYVNDNNPTPLNDTIDLVFEPIKMQLKRDLTKYNHIKGVRSELGKKGAEIKKQNKAIAELAKANEAVKDKVTVTDKVTDTDTGKDKVLDIYNSFQKFWELYPTKVSKHKCKDKWDKIPDAEKETIFETLPDFVKYKPFESYTHPNPLTYLNQKRWEDEIKPKSKEITHTLPVIPDNKW